MIYEPDDERIPPAVKKQRDAARRTGDGPLHLIQFFDKASQWYVSFISCSTMTRTECLVGIGNGLARVDCCSSVKTTVSDSISYLSSVMLTMATSFGRGTARADVPPTTLEDGEHSERLSRCVCVRDPSDSFFFTATGAHLGLVGVRLRRWRPRPT